MKFIDVFVSDKQRSCEGGQEGSPCLNKIEKGEIYVLINIGNGKLPVCRGCFKNITDRLNQNIVWDNKAKKYKKH